MPQKIKNAKKSQKALKFNHFFNTILSIVLTLILFAGVFFVSNFFSDLLTIKTISNLNIHASTKDITVHSISVLSSNNKQEAVDFAESIKERLAAGYVINNNNVFEVLTSAYANEKDAQSVVNKLNESGENAKIVKIKLDGILININLTDNANKILQESLNLFFNSFDALQKISLKYDSSNFDIIQAKNEIMFLSEKNMKQTQKFNEQFKSSNNIKMAYIKIFLSKLNGVVDELLNIENTLEFGWQIKYKYFECLYLYKNLQKEL